MTLQSELFPPAFFRALDALARRRVQGGLGNRQCPRPGRQVRGVEHRLISRGDSFRDIDWRASARQDDFLVRQPEEERGGHLVIWLDRSASQAPQNKQRDFAQRRLAYAAAWLALESGASVQVQGATFSGSQAASQVQSSLLAMPPPHGNDKTFSMSLAPMSNSRVFVLTDPWAGAAYWSSFEPFAQSQKAISSVILVSPEERHPPSDLLEMRDAESGELIQIDLVNHRAGYFDAFEQQLNLQQAKAASVGVRLQVSDLPQDTQDFEALLQIIEASHVV
ncbi:MAG: DUF58 domain-containing protein [Planctomycetes bacterium]|jgi:uncharacterized protein (DUF58 family)|nr:DUF58 domain-containing protein [Planctomycetota bacterium]MBT7319012.1 DUF58 domain-containing protein [Planctomycetota bacterium]